jgi:hypothetical protein
MSLSRRIKKLWSRLAEPGALRLFYQGVTLTPRLILHVASVAALAGLLGACVPATRYEEAKSASEVELLGRQRAQAELQATRAKLDAAQAELEQRSQKLAETEQSVSESKLESSVAVKERDEATGIVEQLRGELARVGDNLRSYAQQKTELEKSLQVAQARKLELEQNEAHTVAIARLTRDLTSALGERVLSGDVTVDVRDGRVVLSAAPELWFNDDGTLRQNSDALLAAVSRVLVLHKTSSLELSLPTANAEQRAPTLLGALSAKGVLATRMNVAVRVPAPLVAGADAPSKPSLPDSVELSFSAG